MGYRSIRGLPVCSASGSGGVVLDPRKFQVSSSMLSSEQNSTSNKQPEINNLNRISTERSVVKSGACNLKTVIIASILLIILFVFSIAEKHAEAVTILEQAISYQSKSVLYNALGDSYKALEKYQSAEQQYLQAANMAPAKFYLLYLLAKLYEASGQQQKAMAIANTLLNKEVKVHSTAIEEIKEEMKQIIEQ
jgi:tetratricopeptide (TPR) repeat protein